MGRNKKTNSNFIHLVFLMFLLSGCFTVKKAKKSIRKIEDMHPITLVEYCAKTFPSKGEMVSEGVEVVTLIDTMFQQIDTIDCYDSDAEPVRIPCPPAKTIRVEKVRVDTFKYENTAAIAYRDSIIQRERVNIEALKQKASKDRRFWINGFILAVVVILFMSLMRR